jgi:hypothetical protein
LSARASASAAWRSSKGSELAAYLASAQRLGVIRSTSRYELAEAEWAALTHDQRITLALAAFCHDAGAAGRATTVLYGLHDGRIKARVVDGNYFEG